MEALPGRGGLGSDGGGGRLINPVERTPFSAVRRTWAGLAARKPITIGEKPDMDSTTELARGPASSFPSFLSDGENVSCFRQGRH